MNNSSNLVDDWHFFNRELAKLYEIIDAYDVLFTKIDLNKNRYNPAFKLILDSFTRTLSVGVGIFYDKRRDTKSLYKFKELSCADLDREKVKADEVIELRHNSIAHISISNGQASNYIHFSHQGIQLVKSCLGDIKDFLDQVSIKKNLNETYAMTWVGLSTSFDWLITDLEFTASKRDLQLSEARARKKS